jgi:hypothetical protein
MDIQGKRKAPNGMYWGNIFVPTQGSKLVMVEPINEKTYRAWTNCSKLFGLKGWVISEKRSGWAYYDLPKEEFTIFDW